MNYSKGYDPLKSNLLVSIRYSQSLLELVDFLENDPDDKDVLTK